MLKLDSCISCQLKRKLISLVVRGKNIRWVADLINLHKLAPSNNNYKYILNIVDSFSKKLWSIPLKTKGSLMIASEFDKLFTQQAPNILQSDNGKEFRNDDLAKICKKHEVEQVCYFC